LQAVVEQLFRFVIDTLNDDGGEVITVTEFFLQKLHTESIRLAKAQGIQKWWRKLSFPFK
jgi:hypothetical protein